MSFQAESWPATIGLHISQFDFLTSLNLDKLPVQCKAITSVLGKSCPQLRWLRIGFANYSLATEDLLGIFYSGDLNSLTKVAHQDFPSSEQLGEQASESVQNAYHKCLVPTHLLYPFCQTLEEIRINHFDSDEPYVIAFVLRHLPRLKQLETSDFEFKDYSASIRALWSIRESAMTGNSLIESMCCLPSDSDSVTLSSFPGKVFFVAY